MVSLNKNFPLMNQAFSKGVVWKNKWIWIGGVGLEQSKSITFVNLNNYKESRICNEIFRRVNHSLLRVERYLLIHGGEYKDNFQKQWLLQDLIIFDILDQKIYTTVNSIPEMKRRGHIGFYFNNKYFFEGGYSNNSKLRRGIYSYNLLTGIF